MSGGAAVYAFLTGSLPFDDENVQVLFRKIKSGAFAVPEYLNPQVVDLLRRMLTVDPTKRARISDVRNHSWFKVDLLSYLFPDPNADESSLVDADAVAEICEKFNVAECDVHEALLRQDVLNQLVIAYNLITDNKRIWSEAQKVEITDFYLASSPPQSSFLSFCNSGSPSALGCDAAIVQPTIHPETMPPLSCLDQTASGTESKQTSPTVRRAKWHLGIRSQSRPQDIIHEVLKALKILNMQWKYCDNSMYNLRVRSIRDVEQWKKNACIGPMPYEIGLQLYQVDNRSYLLDFRSITPCPKTSTVKTSSDGENIEATSSETMQFFEQCAKLVSTLAQ